MSAQGPGRVEPTERITLDDIRHRAEEVKDLAVTESKEAAARVASLDATKVAMVAVGVAVLVVGLAYMAGSRSAARRASAL